MQAAAKDMNYETEKKSCFTLIGTPLRVNKRLFAGNVKYFNDFPERKV